MAIVTVQTNIEGMTVIFMEGSTTLSAKTWAGNTALYNQAYIGQEITVIIYVVGQDPFELTFTVTDPWMELTVTFNVDEQV